MSSKTSYGSMYTESWIPVKAINNGMIELNNNFKVTGVKIKPRNIFILDKGTHDSVIASLRTFYDTLDFEFWIISNDRPVDISDYMATLEIQYSNTQDARIRKLLMQDVQKANDFMNDNVTDIEYFLLFKDKNMDMIQKKLRTIMMGLSN